MERMEHTWSERRSTTLRDVAREVGVSESTVSVVLNRTRSRTRVSANTRRVVLEAAERLGYRPNALARSLQTGQTHRIGMYSGFTRLDARNLFFAELLGGMFEGSLEHGTNTVVHTSGFDPDHLIELVSNRAIDGLVIHARDDDPIIPMLDDLRVPVVAVADGVPNVPSVVVDDETGGWLQAKHLDSLGHKNVLYKQTSAASSSSMRRMNAFINAAAQFGMEVSLHEDPYESEPLTPRDMAALSRTTGRISAIVNWNDQCAERVCQRLNEMGMEIPKEVAVIGFDGFRAFYTPRYHLTTIRAPWVEVGRRAVGILMNLIKGDSVPSITVLPTEFIRGETT